MMIAALALSRKILKLLLLRAQRCYRRWSWRDRCCGWNTQRNFVETRLDAEEKLPTPKLSRLLLHFGALAAADVVSQTLLLKLEMRLNKMQLLLAARRWWGWYCSCRVVANRLQPKQRTKLPLKTETPALTPAMRRRCGGQQPPTPTWRLEATAAEALEAWHVHVICLRIAATKEAQV